MFSFPDFNLPCAHPYLLDVFSSNSHAQEGVFDELYEQFDERERQPVDRNAKPMRLSCSPSDDMIAEMDGLITLYLMTRSVSIRGGEVTFAGRSKVTNDQVVSVHGPSPLRRSNEHKGPPLFSARQYLS